MTKRVEQRGARGGAMVAMIVVVAMVATSCLFTPAARRIIDASGGTEVPWWCDGLTPEDCITFSVAMDLALNYANNYPALADFTATGATEITDGPPPNAGRPYGTVGSTFDPFRPNVLLYDGDSPTSRLVGFAWAIDSVGPPAGFDGSRDVWTTTCCSGAGVGSGTVPPSEVWWLPAWMVRGYENHPDVFAAGHPCLTPPASLTSTTDACFLASHTEPLQVLVTNDDGYDAEGIDAIVEGLFGVAGLSIDIVAPLENQSGSGDSYTPGGVSGTPVTTLSGRAATAVDGEPADAVLHALQELDLTPDLVVSGINEGQNLNGIGDQLSGTVGSARMAARNYIPSVATSQGEPSFNPPPEFEADYPTGVAAVLDWVEHFRLGLAGPPFMKVASINIPTCEEGLSPRGTIETVVGAGLAGRDYFMQDCASTVPVGSITDDVDAFNQGFIGIADMGLG